MGQDSQIDYDNLDIKALLSAETLNKYHTTSIITNIATINTCECGLDGALSELRIKNYSINKSTLEDVFINLSKIEFKYIFLSYIS